MDVVSTFTDMEGIDIDGEGYPCHETVWDNEDESVEVKIVFEELEGKWKKT